MNILDFSRQLRELADNYSDQRITFADYRTKRKDILDKIDSNMNGIRFPGKAETSSDSLGIL